MIPNLVQNQIVNRSVRLQAICLVNGTINVKDISYVVIRFTSFGFYNLPLSATKFTYMYTY